MVREVLYPHVLRGRKLKQHDLHSLRLVSLLGPFWLAERHLPLPFLTLPTISPLEMWPQQWGHFYC